MTAFLHAESHFSDTLRCRIHQQHILILAQLQLSIADIHGHLIAQQQGLKVRVGIAWLRNALNALADEGRRASGWRCYLA